MIEIEEKRVRKYILLILAEFVVGLILVFFSIVFQTETSFQSVMDGIMVTGITMGLFGFLILLSSIGVYETIEYCVMYIGSKITKRPLDITFFEAVYLRERRDGIIHRTVLLTSLIFLIAGSVMYYIYYTQMIT